MSRLQLVAAAEILRLLVDEHEPWPDDDKAPLTLLQETWIKTQQSVVILGEPDRGEERGGYLESNPTRKGP